MYVELLTASGRILASSDLRNDPVTGSPEKIWLVLDDGHGREGFQLRVEVIVHNGIPMISESQFAAYGETL